jgi:hypothetical protein
MFFFYPLSPLGEEQRHRLLNMTDMVRDMVKDISLSMSVMAMSSSSPLI